MPLIPNPQPRLFPALLLRLPKIDRQHREVEDVDDAVAVGVGAPHAAHSHGVIPTSKTTLVLVSGSALNHSVFIHLSMGLSSKSVNLNLRNT